MPVSDWADLCPHVVVWQPLASRDAYGKPNHGTPQTFAGRRVYGSKRVAAYERGTKGQGPEVISESQIWILGTPDVKYDDLVYVQGDSEPFPPVLDVKRYPDENGDLYVKVMMGSANG